MEAKVAPHPPSLHARVDGAHHDSEDVDGPFHHVDALIVLDHFVAIGRKPTSTPLIQ